MSQQDLAEVNAERAIIAIKRILADDINYQCASLKLGAIWWQIDNVAECFHIGEHVEIRLKRK